jgi:hypothetical protein
MNLIKNCIKHFKLICSHKYYVFIECCKVGIPLQGLVHDLSKFSPTEFFTSAKYYIGTGTPIAEERKDKGWSDAWVHHAYKNKHHWQRWLDISETGITPVRIPRKYVFEAFCDMVGASKAYNRKEFKKEMPLEYFKKNEKSYIMHLDSSLLLELLLVEYSKGNKISFF